MRQVLKDVFTFTQAFMYKKMFYIGLGAYFVMLLLSILYYKERIIFTDTAYNLFHIVRTGSFCISQGRFGDLVAQVPPLILRKAGASLNAIIGGYSVAFPIIYLACYLVCGLAKQYRFALVILLLNVLITAYTFYWPVSQVPQGMALWVVVLALIPSGDSQRLGLAKAIAIIVCLVTLAFFHPLIVPIVAYSVAFFYRNTQTRIHTRALLGAVGILIFTLVIKAVFFRVPYEQHSLSALKNFVRLFPDYFTIYSNKAFLYNCLTKYYWLPTLSLVVLLHYIKHGQRRRLWLFATSMIGYLMLVNICYPSSETPPFYIENLYLPLGFFVSLPLVFDVLPQRERSKIALPVFLLILVSGCVRMYATHPVYTARLNYERELLQTYAGKKAVVGTKTTNEPLLQILWGTPYEFWLLSQVEQGRTASLIIDKDPNARYWAGDLNKSFVVNWNVFPYKELPSQYFNFADTTTGYYIIP